MITPDGACKSGVPNHAHVPSKDSIPPCLAGASRALQRLGRGNFFDEVCQLSFMSESTVQSSFHLFCKHFAEELYDDHIYLPTGAAQGKVMEEYHKLGLTGAIASTGVTHAPCDCCTHSLLLSYTGKEGFPTIAYQATVDHSGLRTTRR